MRLALVIDEMAIRRRIEWDGNKFYGHIDIIDTGLNGDHLAEAKEVLFFLITAINNGVTGALRSELVKQCIERVHDVGIKIVALTFNGCAANNISMIKHLGCSLQDKNITFKHPSTKDSICVILDPCHMIKLIRNTLQTSQKFIDNHGKMLKWQY
uniref:SFRICE_006736 n=1 Tax=Spodoptera frugiperda TaxID=7108 RepID=A0A2H1VLX6_SPOFR